MYKQHDNQKENYVGDLLMIRRHGWDVDSGFIHRDPIYGTNGKSPIVGIIYLMYLGQTKNMEVCEAFA